MRATLVVLLACACLVGAARVDKRSATDGELAPNTAGALLEVAQEPEGPSYLLPVDPNSSPFGNFLPAASNFNPLNPNSQYSAFQATQASPATPSVPAVASPAQTTGQVGQTPTSAFLEIENVMHAMTRAHESPVVAAENPTYVLPADPYQPPFTSFLPPGSDFNPLNPNSVYQAFRSAQSGQAGAGLPTSPPQAVLPSAASSFFEMRAAAKVRAKDDPTYLLPVDPNAPTVGTFMPPGSNVNPLHPNSQFSQTCKTSSGAACSLGAVGPGNLQSGAVPVGVASGSNSVPDFPQFVEVEDNPAFACQNCVYERPRSFLDTYACNGCRYVSL